MQPRSKVSLDLLGPTDRLAFKYSFGWSQTSGMNEPGRRVLGKELTARLPRSLNMVAEMIAAPHRRLGTFILPHPTIFPQTPKSAPIPATGHAQYPPQSDGPARSSTTTSLPTTEIPPNSRHISTTPRFHAYAYVSHKLGWYTATGEKPATIVLSLRPPAGFLLPTLAQ
ncbi:hypothetical protein B9Z19DRAFT_1105172 [Tuber borchii]|uniref:Uncharacterized protein n=1 Tax=Tuber borchii TaxID=42251 RepID=A0A2T7A6Q5_TUBBO|nr:hypothetical protein B9Z19DRAFT_1105172 [Tuber borchii]